MNKIIKSGIIALLIIVVFALSVQVTSPIKHTSEPVASDWQGCTYLFDADHNLTDYRFYECEEEDENGEDEIIVYLASNNEEVDMDTLVALGIVK